MRRTRHLEEVRRLLEAAGLEPKQARAEAPPLLALLRTGAGEEGLLLELGRMGGDAQAQSGLARSLLRIGVRPRGGGYRKRRLPSASCTICERSMPFCWSCRCGFLICQECLEENRWGMTCNNITWECPDCGAMRSF